MNRPSRSLRALRIALLTMTAGATVASLSLVAGGRSAAREDKDVTAENQALFPPGAVCRGSAAMRGRIRLAQSRTGVSPMGRPQPMPPEEFADSTPPLWEGLGTLSYKITTKSKDAQAFFDQGLRLAFAFNHAEAQRAFRQAQRLDPDCAMCFWGEALVLGPNINMSMMPGAVPPAFTAISKATALAKSATARERELITALAKRYTDDPKADRKPLDEAYATAMREVSAQFPEDDAIATLYAEALMDLSPWDYWQAGGKVPNPQSADIVPTLERVLKRTPDHPGAIHLYIHAVEASDRPERAEAYADRLRGAMPAAGHMVHMPSHIYYRIGRYSDALKVNVEAIAADEKYLAETKAPVGVYRLGYYPHNVHFVLASAQMIGDGKTVIDAAEKLAAVVPDEAAREIVLAQPVKVARYFAHALFSPPETVLALADPGDSMPFVKAMWHYARGIALVGRGDLAAARAEADAIAAIDRTADFSALKRENIPSSEVLQIANHIIRGRVLQAEKKFTDAIGSFEQAASLQAKLPYMEPPYWYYPVRQSLGAVLLQAGRLDEAEKEFEQALRRSPNSGWAYYGLIELAKARGDAAGAKQAQSMLERIWVGDTNALRLSNL
jgi:tetratricopeptide (TPR) repeat protein